MKPSFLQAAIFVFCLAFFQASPALATVACSVTSEIPDAQSVALFAEPDDTSEIIRQVPLGDLVRWPQEELAPTQAEGWSWVRHNVSQEDIWQSGEFGWIKSENLSVCG